MTINANYRPVSYEANGVATSFTIPWKFVNKEVSVKNESGVAYSEDLYTVYNAEGKNGAGGYVIFKSAPEEGHKVVIYRETSLVQDVDFIEGENFPAEDFEYTLDKLYMALQEASYNTGVELDEILSSIYTKAQIDDFLADTVKKTELENALRRYYTKDEVDVFLNNKLNRGEAYSKSEVYTKSEVDSKIGDIDGVLDVINGEVI